MLKRLASYILYSLVTIVSLSAGAAGAGVQGWEPKRKDLEIISVRNAVIVIGVTLLIIAGLIFLVIRAFHA